VRWTALAAAALLAALASAAGDPPVVAGPLVVNDRWPQATGLASWTRDVMRIEGLQNAPETAQGKAFFEWLRLYCRMAVGGMIQAYEGDFNQERYVTDAHKNLFVYGWGYCDTCSRIADAAWKEYKQDAAASQRVITQHGNGGYHTMYRLRLDGRYGAFDPRYGYYLLERDSPDARVLDWPEVGVDSNVIRNREFRHRSRPFFEIGGIEWERTLLIEPAFFESEQAWRKAGAPKEHVFANSHYKLGARFHDMDFRLPKGTTIERFWDGAAQRFYAPAGKHTQREFPFLASGRFYRVTESSHDGNWAKHDPNYGRAKPYLGSVPRGQGYPQELDGARTIGQAWGSLRYEPAPGDLGDALAPGATLVRAATAPYLRPPHPEAGGEAVFDFYSPYVLVEGRLEAEMAGAATVEIRTLRAKATSPAEPDVWSPWQTLGAGRIAAELGRPRFNGADVSIHGVYRLQLRVTVPPAAGRTAPAGLNHLRLRLDFENGIMSIPPIFAGENTLRVRLRDASLLRGPVRVVYHYETAAGNKTHTQVLRPSDFRENTAVYRIDAPGLLRCRSVTVAH
jgi:hypothetical protein